MLSGPIRSEGPAFHNVTTYAADDADVGGGAVASVTSVGSQGRVTVNVVPRPNRELTLIVPPCACTIH